MGGMSGATGGPVDETDFAKSEEDEAMVRSIDFTVDGDSTYRFRLRIVVVNPNYLRGDVSPGTETESLELKGPWSEPSNEVTVPADVAAYAMSSPPTSRGLTKVSFQLVRWNPEDGHTVTRNETAAPGEMIGTLGGVAVPASDGSGQKNIRVDFNSRQVIVDAMGGPESPPVNFKGLPPFVVPAISLALRPDGLVAVHSQARDVPDEVRVEMESNYRKALKDSGKKREPMGGMGGYGGSGGSGGGMR